LVGIGKGRDMDEDQRDLLNRLFALMTAMFEDAAALAADG